MTATTTYRSKTNQASAAPLPTRGTFTSAANKLYLGGTIVQRDASGLATPGADGNGFPAVGVAENTYDYRTGSEAVTSGAELAVQVKYGVFGFNYDGDPLPGETVWVLDNQTVSDDSDTGARGVAGVCTEIRGDQCYVWMGPHVAQLFSDDSALESAVTTAQADIDALQADALSTHGKIDIPILDGILLATGIGVSAVAPSSGTPGTAIADSKSAVVKWLADATPDAIVVNVAVPNDLDDAANVVFHALVSKSGATVGDATKLTVAAFEIVPAALHDADVDFGGDTDAVVGDATAKTVDELTLTFTAANIHPYSEGICLQIKPKAGTLGTDNFYLHAAWLEYTRKLRTE
jgi:hypothetical protein